MGWVTYPGLYPGEPDQPVWVDEPTYEQDVFGGWSPYDTAGRATSLEGYGEANPADAWLPDVYRGGGGGGGVLSGRIATMQAPGSVANAPQVGRYVAPVAQAPPSNDFMGGGYAWLSLMYQMQVEKAKLELQRLQWLTELGKSPRNWLQYWAAKRAMGMPTEPPMTGPQAEAVIAARRGLRGNEEIPGGPLAALEEVPQEPEWLKALGGFTALPNLQIGQAEFNRLLPGVQEGLAGGVEWMGDYYPDWLKRIGETWANWGAGPLAGFKFT